MCVLKTQGTVAASPKRTQKDSSFGCSKYSNDYQVIQFLQYSTKTYSKMDKYGNIYFLNIANQKCVLPAIFCLKSLRELYIRNTNFCDFGLSLVIERFGSSLTHLGIHNSMVTHLPEQIGKLKRLKFLELYNTGLISLPNAIGNLVSLTHLLLPYNNLTLLPITITKLRSLKQITLSDNPRLRSIQELNGLPSVDMIDASYCSIDRLPLNLPRLNDLRMSGNNLTNLTGIWTLGQASNNASFCFDENYIPSIPSEIRNVNNLHRLNMNYNQLHNLPLDIFNIPTLHYFHIGNNNFSSNDLKEIREKFNKTNPNLQLTD